tara:strand:- start:206 stop:547 length:342 start_codon:yes stop_codon:yes gene_type:complete
MEEKFYFDKNYFTYNITYFIKYPISNNIYKECIYYYSNENFNNETIIDISNVKIDSNITYTEYDLKNLYGLCKVINYNYDTSFIFYCAIIIFICCICISGDRNKKGGSMCSMF